MSFNGKLKKANLYNIEKIRFLNVLVSQYELVVIARFRVQVKLYYPSCELAFRRVKYEEQQNMNNEENVVHIV